MNKPLTFKVNIETPSQNVYSGWHWSKKHKYRNDCFVAVKEALGNYNYESIPPHSFHFERVGKRLIDPLNCFSAYKPLMDSFTEYGIIEDDSCKYIKSVTGSQSKCKKGEKPHVIITVT